MTQTEALKLALDALELPSMKTQSMLEQRDAAITAIKEALAQPDAKKSALSLYESGFIDGREKGLKEAQPEQEPVVWMYQDKSTHEVRFQKHMRDFVDHGATYETPLYTTPPQRTWVGLTDSERNDCLVSADPCEALAKPEAEQLMEDIEEMLRSKNT